MSVLRPFVRRRGGTPFYTAELFLFRGGEMNVAPSNMWEASGVAYALVLERDRTLNLYRDDGGGDWVLVNVQGHPWIGSVMPASRNVFSAAMDGVGRLVIGCVDGPRARWVFWNGSTWQVEWVANNVISFVVASDAMWAPQEIGNFDVFGFVSNTFNEVAVAVVGSSGTSVIETFSERVMVERVLTFPGGFQLPVSSNTSGELVKVLVSEGYYSPTFLQDSLALTVSPIASGLRYNPTHIDDSLAFSVTPIASGVYYEGVQFIDPDELPVTVTAISSGSVFHGLVEESDELPVLVTPISAGARIGPPETEYGDELVVTVTPISSGSVT